MLFQGSDTAHEEGVGRIPPQGGPQADGSETMEGTVQRLGLPPSGGCHGGDRFAGCGDLRLPPQEHFRAVYCDWAYYGPVSGGEAEARAKGGNAVLGTGGSVFGGDADGDPGGGAYGGVYRWYGGCDG